MSSSPSTTEKVGVLGAGTMGHGIAQVCAMAGYRVVLVDNAPEALASALAKVRANLDKGIAKGKLDAAARDEALARLGTGTLEEAATDAGYVIEAVQENLELKRALLAAAAAVAPPGCVLATNTSSLSVSRIAEAVPDPARVIGAHFFNPVHLMELLEVVVGTHTDEPTLARVEALGARLGKTVIVVRDAPGFATSRLGVCLGMEAIRMVEQGVASPEDIDKAMVLGYRHPMGPLELTDLVGLDVRMHIGAYLAQELGNPSFEPPALLRRMVAEGRLGKKAGRGFYDWD